MSINALTNAAVARRPDFQPVDAVPATLAEIASAAASVPMPVALPSGARPATVAAPKVSVAPAAGSGPNTALQTLTTYIPTEVLTLYVSAIAALGPLTITVGTHDLQVGRWLPFWCFFCRDAVNRMGRFRLEDKGRGKRAPAFTIEMAIMGDVRGDDCVCGMDFCAADHAVRAGELVLGGTRVVPDIGGFGRARDRRPADAAAIGLLSVVVNAPAP